MATLSSYLSRAPARTVNTAGSSSFPVVKPANPFTSSQLRPMSAAASAPPVNPFSFQTAQAAKPAAPTSTFADTYNYDPIQARIQALGAQSVANAHTNAAQIRKEAAINEGDPDLLRSLGFDTNTITAAQNNPQSLLAQLNLDYSNRHKQLGESMQADNLYYSGEYQKRLLELTQGQAAGQANIGQRLRDLLSGADTGVLDSEESQRQADLRSRLDAEEAANKAAGEAQIAALYQQLLDAMKGPGDNAPPDPGAAPGGPGMGGPIAPGVDYAPADANASYETPGPTGLPFPIPTPVGGAYTETPYGPQLTEITDPTGGNRINPLPGHDLMDGLVTAPPKPNFLEELSAPAPAPVLAPNDAYAMLNPYVPPAPAPEPYYAPPPPALAPAAPAPDTALLAALAQAAKKNKNVMY